MTDIFEQLAAPFDPSEVDWRVGSTTKDKAKGMALAYIDARTVMDRLDAVCGPAGWQNKYVMEGSKTVCEIGILCGETWVWKADGAGDSDVEAEKGALSDAFKRAAVRWGVGRYLYNLKSPWVALKAFGNSYAIADEAKPQLDALLRGNAPKPDAPAKPKRTPKSFVDDAIKAIGTLTDAASLNAWVEANKADLERLRDVYDEGSRQVSGAILETRKSLMRGAAE
jgi:hypothetical protein